MNRDIFQATQPFKVDVGSRRGNFDEFTTSQMPIKVLGYLWTRIILPVVAAVDMTWMRGTNILARPTMMNVLQELRSLCVTLPLTTPAASEQQPGPAAAAAAAEEDELQAEYFLSQPWPADLPLEDDEEDDRLSAAAGHEVNEPLTVKHTPDIIVVSKYPAAEKVLDQSAPCVPSDLVTKLIIEAKDNMYGTAEAEWVRQGMYQMLHRVVDAALHNVQRHNYAGSVVGFATDLYGAGLCKVYVAGVVTVDDDGQCNYCSAVTPGATAAAHQQYAQQLKNVALSRVHEVSRCESVDQLRPGTYLVGGYANSPRPHNFLPASWETRTTSPCANSLGGSGYKLLQGLLMTCAEKQACTWTVEQLKARHKEWQRRQEKLADTSAILLTEEHWQPARQQDAQGVEDEQRIESKTKVDGAKPSACLCLSL